MVATCFRIILIFTFQIKNFIVRYIIYNIEFKAKKLQILKLKQMTEFQQNIRTHFNVIHRGDYLSLTLINPNISIDIMKEIKQKYKFMSHIKKQQVIIIQTPNFDDQLLTSLAQSLPSSLTELSLDFTGCESLKGSGFLQLFQKISSMENLSKLHLDFCQVYDINDIVIEGLTMLLQSLTGLTEFYLDLYEVDQISQDGYLMLAQSISNLKNIQKLHIDLSANPSLTEDSLQLLFSNFSPNLISLGFRILDIQHIGGGSFFKLAESLTNMKKLQELNLTISTFQNLNHKGTYSVFKSISTLDKLKNCYLNLSNINMPQKMLSYLSFSKYLRNLTLDVSCNQNLSDRDIVSLVSKIHANNILKSASFNFDFCTKITQQAIQTLLQKVCQNKSLIKLALPDRNYSYNFVGSCIKIIETGNCSKSMINFTCSAVKDMNKFKQLQVLEIYKKNQKNKRNIIFAGHLLKNNKYLSSQQRLILQLLVH